MGGKAGLIAKKRAAMDLKNEESSGTETESEDEDDSPPKKKTKKDNEDSESNVEYDTELIAIDKRIDDLQLLLDDAFAKKKNNLIDVYTRKIHLEYQSRETKLRLLTVSKRNVLSTE